MYILNVDKICFSKLLSKLNSKHFLLKSATSCIHDLNYYDIRNISMGINWFPKTSKPKDVINVLLRNFHNARWLLATSCEIIDIS